MVEVANKTQLILQTWKDKVFVIAYLGTGETLRRLNRRRLNNIRMEFGDNFRGGKIILAEGRE